MSLRCAEADDAEQIIELLTELAEHGEGQVSVPEDLSITLEREQRWIADHQEREGWIALAAVAGSQVVGLANFENGLRVRLRHHGEFGLACRPGWRGAGIGRALLERLLEWLTDHAVIERVSLRVRSDNDRARGLYRSLGFEDEGRIRQHIKLAEGEFVDTCLMARCVRGVSGAKAGQSG